MQNGTPDETVGRGGRGRWIARRLELVAWIAVLAFVGHRIWPQAAAALGVGAAEGPVAPAFSVATLDGGTVSLSSLRGRVVLVNVWATWCPPCRFEMPGFQSVWESRRERGFVVLGLSTDATGAAGVRAFLEERGITYPVAMAPPGLVSAFGGANLVPTSFLLDRQGRIRHTVEGIFAEAALARAVDRLLEEP